MKNTEIISFLKDFENNISIEFIEDSKQISDLFAIAKAKGILVEGSRDLAIFKGIFDFTEVSNKNGKRLPTQEVLKALPSLIGKPITWEHIRRFVVGYCVNYSYIQKENKILVWGIIFKNCFSKEYEQMVIAFKNKKLGLSSEVWSPKSRREYLPDGTYFLHDIEFAGVTIVIIDDKNKPANPNTLVLEMSKNYEEKKELIYSMLNKDGIIDLHCGKDTCGQCDVCKCLITSKEEIASPPSISTPIIAPVNNIPSKMKIICAHCGNNFEQLFVTGQNNPINCPNCHSVVDQNGKVIYPPQIKNFNLSCKECQSRNNFLTLSSKDNEVNIKCNSCGKEYDVKFKTIPEDYQKLLSKIMFLRTGRVSCIQCGTSNEFSAPSSQNNIDIKCQKCGLKFDFDITNEIQRDIESVEESKKKDLPKEIKEEKKMVMLEKSKVNILLRKAVKKMNMQRKAMEEKELENSKLSKKALEEKDAEIEKCKNKITKFGKGIKKYAKNIKELKGKNKKEVLENSKLQILVKEKDKELAVSKLTPTPPIEEPKLETSKSTILGNKPKDESYYANTRAKVDEIAFGVGQK